MSVRLSLVAVVAALVAACNPYDPDLGNAPFRCGTSEPRCPDGYTCVTFSAADQFCEKNAGPVADGGNRNDSGTLSCDPAPDSELEPNESITDPTITPIPDFGDDYDLIGLAICGGSDTDVFRFRIDVTGKNARIEVNYVSSQGTVLVDMLNSTGVSIRAGTATGGNPDVLRADVANMAQGEYFAQVKGMGDVVNEYDIKILTTTDTLPQ